MKKLIAFLQTFTSRIFLCFIYVCKCVNMADPSKFTGLNGGYADNKMISPQEITEKVGYRLL
jgi:hypothetical protein